jgi:hypothetical protein
MMEQMLECLSACQEETMGKMKAEMKTNKER